jgi:Putative DNA-binding domain
MPMLKKGLADLEAKDFVALCDEGMLEDEQIDFKQAIPFRDMVQDPWSNAPDPQKRQISGYGRDELFGTVVAFANSYGGDLIVGVREAPGSQPGQAQALEPIPAAEDAARRLGQMANTGIEPPLTALEVRAVQTSNDGSGIIVLRTARSRLAPHRVTKTRECFHRVRDETLPMTMRQIQDLTFSVARGLEAVDRKFGKASDTFYQWALPGQAVGVGKRICLRVTAIPASDDVYIDRVHNVQALLPGQRSPNLSVGEGPGKGPFTLAVPFQVTHWQPALRGTEGTRDTSRYSARLGVYCDGTVRYETVIHTHPQQVGMAEPPHVLYPGWYFAMVANAVETADRFRTAAGASAVEYAVESEIGVSHELAVLRLGNNPHDPAGHIRTGRWPFPRYAVGATETIRETYLQMYRDFWNSIGIDTEHDEFILT